MRNNHHVILYSKKIFISKLVYLSVLNKDQIKALNYNYNILFLKFFFLQFFVTHLNKNKK